MGGTNAGTDTTGVASDSGSSVAVSAGVGSACGELACRELVEPVESSVVTSMPRGALGILGILGNSVASATGSPINSKVGSVACPPKLPSSEVCACGDIKAVSCATLAIGVGADAAKLLTAHF